MNNLNAMDYILGFMLLVILGLIGSLAFLPMPKENRDFSAVVEETKVERFSDFTLIYTDIDSVHKACYVPGSKDDNGKVRKEAPDCCYDGARKEMWISYYHAGCFAHEECHKEGRPDSECSKINF